MTKRVYEKMQTLQILPSNQIYLKYFEHQRKEFKEKKDKDRSLGGESTKSGSSSKSSSHKHDKDDDKSAMM